MSKLISVIIPAYNVENYLTDCLDSVLRQDNGEIEIILVNDGAKDSTPAICEEYSKKYPVIRYFSKENGGLSSARNYGMKQAKGEYLLFLDSDDLLAGDAIENITRICREEHDLIVGRYFDYYDDTHHIAECPYSLKDMPEKGEEFLGKIIESRSYDWYAWLNIGRRDFLLENGLYFDEGVNFEDMRWTPQVILAAQNIGCLEKPFYTYRRNRPGSITATFSEKNFISKIGVLDFTEDFCKKNGLGHQLRTLMFANMANLFVSMLFDSWYFPKKQRKEYLQLLKGYKFILKNSARSYHRLLNAFWSVFGVTLTSYILYLRAAAIRKERGNK